MEPENRNSRRALAAILACLGAAGLFAALTLLATQVRTVRTASPWQDDPYDAVVSFTVFAVPMLALVIALRLLAWRAPGGPDRARQTLRAAGAMLTLIGLTLAFEWAALAGRVHRPDWNRWTAVLVTGLAAMTGLAVAAAVLLVRYRARGHAGPWRHDWLGDVVLVCRRFPVARQWVTPELADRVRRRAMALFVALSALAAAVLAGALAVGERWTNPLLFAWVLVVMTTSNLAFCVISNAVAGFIARPPRGRRRRITEASVVTGGVAIHVATAFRDALHHLIGVGPTDTVPSVAALTLGTGLVAALVTAGLLAVRTPDPR